jgi:molybdopterin converting factor small subunit
MPKITIRLIGFLKKYSTIQRINLDIPEGTSAGEVHVFLRIPNSEIFQYIVNQEVVSADYLLRNNDVLDIVPPFAGG